MRSTGHVKIVKKHDGCTYPTNPKGKKCLFDSQVIGGEDVNKLHYMCP